MTKKVLEIVAYDAWRELARNWLTVSLQNSHNENRMAWWQLTKMDGWPFFCRLGTSPLRSTERFQQREETFQQPFLVAGLLVSVKGGRGIRAGRNLDSPEKIDSHAKSHGGGTGSYGYIDIFHLEDRQSIGRNCAIIWNGFHSRGIPLQVHWTPSWRPWLVPE